MTSASLLQELEAAANDGFSTNLSKFNRLAYSAMSGSATQWHDYTAKIVAGGTIFFVLIVGCILANWIRKDIAQKEAEKAKEAQERQQLDEALVNAKAKVDQLGGGKGGAPPQSQQFGAPDQFGPPVRHQSMPVQPVSPPTWGFFPSPTEPPPATPPTWGYFPTSTDRFPQSGQQQTPNTWPGLVQQQPSSQFGQSPQGFPAPAGLAPPAGLEQAIAQMAGGNPYKLVDVAVMPGGPAAPPSGGYTVNLTPQNAQMNQPAQNWGAQPSYQQQGWR